MRFMKKAAATVAAISLALSLTSCGTDVSWAAKIGKDTTVPIGLYIYTQAVNFRTNAQSGLLTTSSKLDEQTIKVSDSDKNATEYLDTEALKTVKAYTGACILAKEMEQELTEDEIAAAESSAKKEYETDKEVYEKNGIAQSSITEYYKNLTLQNKLFNAIYGKDGTEPVTDKELKQYIKDNYATISYIQQYYYKDDGSMMSDTEKAKIKKQYEKIKKQAESGKIKFADKCKEFQENATSYKSGSTKYTCAWNAADEDGQKVLSLKEGQLTFLETDSAIVLLQKQKIDYNDAGIKTYRDSILIQYKYNDFVKDLIAKAESDKSVSFNQAAFDKFGSATRDFSNLSIPSNYSYY
ncbi:MAG: hypothetical protein IJM51_01190 [Clostridia bacterium]|nr:hypothetical protein [Clostridia bacterium]